MMDRDRRLARLEASTRQDNAPWARIVWDPATGETLDEAKAREGLAGWNGNLIVHEIVDPPPRLETEIGR
jgi:hypothetical protein